MRPPQIQSSGLVIDCLSGAKKEIDFDALFWTGMVIEIPSLIDSPHHPSVNSASLGAGWSP